MRRAMREPVLVWRWLESGDADEAARVLRLMRGRWGAAAADAGAQVRALGLADPEAAAVATVERWESGEDALACWVAFLSTRPWRRVARALVCQPTLHVASARGLDWTPRPDQATEVVEWTADGTVETRADRRSGARPGRGVAAREALPSLDGVQVWPVIGHPGRLLMRGDAGWWDAKAQAHLTDVWGEAVEPARVWRLRELSWDTSNA